MLQALLLQEERSYSVAANAVVVPDLTHANLVGAEGPHDRNLAVTQPPLFFCPRRLHLQKQHGLPGSKSGIRRFLEESHV